MALWLSLFPLGLAGCPRRYCELGTLCFLFNSSCLVRPSGKKLPPRFLPPHALSHPLLGTALPHQLVQLGKALFGQLRQRLAGSREGEGGEGRGGEGRGGEGRGGEGGERRGEERGKGREGGRGVGRKRRQ